MGGINLYAYASNPFNWIDLLGLACGETSLKPEKKYMGSLDDLAFAGEKAATLKPRESGYFELPSGHSSKVHLPNGSVVDATHIWVRNNGSGTFHGYPLIK